MPIKLAMPILKLKVYNNLFSDDPDLYWRSQLRLNRDKYLTCTTIVISEQQKNTYKTPIVDIFWLAVQPSSANWADNFSDNASAMAFKPGKPVNLSTAYMFMPMLVSVTLTLMQGHIGLAEENIQRQHVDVSTARCVHGLGHIGSWTHTEFS